jgi:hypothetical protein
MPLLTRLERKIGWIAIPGLLRYVAFFNLVFFVIIHLNPHVLDFLVLDTQRVASGEIWRLFTMFLIPRTLSPIWVLFSVYFLFFIGDALEKAWGAFAVTLYFLVGMVLADLGWIYFTHQVGDLPQVSRDYIASYVRIMGLPGFYAFQSIFLSFCVCYPGESIRLFGVVPIKAWMLGIVAAVTTLGDCLNNPILFPMMFISMANFFVFAVPVALRHLRQRQAVWDRRAKFEANKLPDVGHFNRCKVCGRTDRTNPELDFRVAEDDQEYCSDHLPVAGLPKAE